MVWYGLFAWGFGSTLINLLAFMLACTYLSGERRSVRSMGLLSALRAVALPTLTCFPRLLSMTQP